MRSWYCLNAGVGLHSRTPCELLPFFPDKPVEQVNRVWGQWGGYQRGSVETAHSIPELLQLLFILSQNQPNSLYSFSKRKAASLTYHLRQQSLLPMRSKKLFLNTTKRWTAECGHLQLDFCQLIYATLPTHNHSSVILSVQLLVAKLFMLVQSHGIHLCIILTFYKVI